jgi:hypothetical protein
VEPVLYNSSVPSCLFLHRKRDLPFIGFGLRLRSYCFDLQVTWNNQMNKTLAVFFAKDGLSLIGAGMAG